MSTDTLRLALANKGTAHNATNQTTRTLSQNAGNRTQEVIRSLNSAVRESVQSSKGSAEATSIKKP